jgi:hypothetical protein
MASAAEACDGKEQAWPSLSNIVGVGIAMIGYRKWPATSKLNNYRLASVGLSEWL